MHPDNESGEANRGQAEGYRVSRRVASRTPGRDLVHAARLGHGDRTAAWVLYELEYVRREAQAEAELAYEAWSELPGRDGYAVYRAAQDRADAAQDELAAWVRGSEGDRPSARRCA
jgi:hypothetical protein